MRSELVKYVRGKHGQRKGVVVAVKGDFEDPEGTKSNFSIGWSALHPNDRFDRDIGLNIARGRAVKGSNTKVPGYVMEDILEMSERASRYFK